jgi:hypothetical protein
MMDRIKESKLKIQIFPFVEMKGGKSEGPIEGFSLCWSCDQQTIALFLLETTCLTQAGSNKGEKVNR